MQIEFDKIAEYMGELCGAAKHDLNTANPSDVGLNGVPVMGWRQAYFEGCKDMAQGIFSRIPEEHREAVKAATQAAFTRAFDEAAKLHAAELAGTPQ